MKIGLSAFLAALSLASPAFAHAHLDSASPAEGAVLTSPPEEILLAFTENLELALSAVTLRDAAGEALEIPAPAHDQGDPRSLRVALPDLAPGVYRVEWSVTSVDTHGSQGEFSFTLK
ncbi:copper resistance protein CopC [Neomegalonema sp.]|uniref:copper resistance CopC family protein n=1 Tax=Neomegalonema sp. TaxID=2039713 RepID=UPI002617D13D|nr:copper resistance protein CopC [Neomegalonema sp.]MDD2868419.1 copper resistance protein CopC [Neomegalonema sp.]